ncbi:MAG: hypothetical protein SOW12_01035 [Lachnospiraceae bacterium]|nr:hypothetical protein [Lachnoclostridium sp.]MDY2598505.1 hypothetical protein [Lachnospiraceae bacterium]
MKLLDLDDVKSNENIEIIQHNNIESSKADMSVEEIQARLQKDQKKIKGSVVFLCSALIAVIVIGVAWFAYNNRIFGSSSSVSAKNELVEIGSKGSKGVHDDLLQSIMKNITYNLPASKKHDTSDGPSINWLLNQDNNMKNYDASSDGQTESDDQSGQNGQTANGIDVAKRQEFALEPGTRGRLDYYIKPSNTGDLSLDFELDIDAYKVTDAGDSSDDEQQYQQVDVSSDEVKMLNGHILYFLHAKADDADASGTDATGNDDSGANATGNDDSGTNASKAEQFYWIKDGRFHIDIKNAEKGKEYEYSIYWVWPLNLATILLNDGDPLLNGQTIEFGDMDDNTRANVISDMQENPESYFYSYLTNTPLTGEADEVKLIKDIHDNSGKGDNTYDKQKYVDLSSYYNQADMKIGDGISFITATLRCLGETEGEANGNEANN